MRHAAVIACVALAALAGCQSADVGGLAVPEIKQAAPAPDAAAQPPTETTLKTEAVASETVQPAKPDTSNSLIAAAADENRRVVDGIREIARLQGSRGDLVAYQQIFACYGKAQQPRAPIADAKVCAAQDFVISKNVLASARSRGGDAEYKRAMLVAERHAQRIGALMEFKGMNQSQFNAFGRFLHTDGKTAYLQAAR